MTTRTVVVEIKYFCTKNVVIHTENCKLNLPLDCSTTQMEKNIRRMCGIDESSRRRGFADFAFEVFYIDFIEAGCSRKAPFVIRTKDQWEMFQKSSCTSLSVRVIQREVTFQKGSVNIALRQNSRSLPKTYNHLLHRKFNRHSKVRKVTTMNLRVTKKEIFQKRIKVEFQAKVVSHLIQMRMPVYHQSLPTTNG